jgi:hypothetical protein
MILPDGSRMETAIKMWEFFKSIYGPFEKVSREIITLTLVPHEANDTFHLHYEGITTVYPKGDEEGIPIPQAFTYVIGKAEEDRETEGYQFYELRNYYDWNLLRKALEKI